MSQINLNFSLAEYADRLSKTRHAMDQAGLKTLIVSDPSNMAWLTGYDGWSFYVHQGVIVSLEHEPIWWGRGMDANGARRTVYLHPDNIAGYEDIYVQNPQQHPMRDLACVLRDRGLANGRIGVELDNYYYSAAAHQTLVEELEDVEFKDATGLVNWQRAVKSPAELEFMHRAARIVEAMHQVVLDKAEPGLRKNELIADIYHASVTGADGHWGDYPAIVPMAPSGVDATAPHLTWDDSPLQRGESTFFEIAGAHKRLSYDFPWVSCEV